MIAPSFHQNTAAPGNHSRPRFTFPATLLLAYIAIAALCTAFANLRLHPRPEGAPPP